MSKKEEILTQEVLRELLDYDPETGKLFWKERDRKWFIADRLWAAWNTRCAGKEAFCKSGRTKYLRGRIFGLSCLSHRVIFCLSHGYYPKFIDHINGDRQDNRLANLREVTRQQNQRNQSLRRTSTTGVLGVTLSKRTGKFIAYTTTDGKHKHLGYCDTLEEARQLRAESDKLLGYHPNHGRPQISL